MLDVRMLNCMDKVQSIEGFELIVNRTSFPLGTDVDDVVLGIARPHEAVLTQDGQGYIPEWHTGEEFGEMIFVERHTLEGRVFHGWIDSVSRKIVQTG